MSMEEGSIKRERWVDMARGLGIIFVILGHLPTYYIITEVYTFHIPLFFFL